MKNYGRRIICGLIGSAIVVAVVGATYGVCRLFGWLFGLVPNKELDAFSVVVTIIGCICFSLIGVLVEWIWKNKIKNRLKSRKRRERKQSADEEEGCS